MKAIKPISKEELLDGSGPELVELASMLERLSKDKIKKFSGLTQIYALLKIYTVEELWRIVGYCATLTKDK